MSTRTRTALRNITRKYLDINDFYDYVPSVAVQGSHSAASTIFIQASTPEGKPIIGTDWLRVRVTDAIGSVTSTTITAAGSGYSTGATVAFSAAPAGGVTATGTITTTSTVTSITLTNAGSGYVTAPTITITPVGSGSGATATAALSTGYAVATTATIAVSTFSEVTSVGVLLGGQNYLSAPTVGFTGGGGTGATATATVDPISGEVTGITVTAGGSGYTTVPTVTFTGGGGTGATALAVVSNTTVEGGTTVVATNTANTDLTLQSNTQGLFEITATSVSSVKTAFTLLLGVPPVANHLGDYSTQLTVTHA